MYLGGNCRWVPLVSFFRTLFFSQLDYFLTFSYVLREQSVC